MAKHTRKSVADKKVAPTIEDARDAMIARHLNAWRKPPRPSPKLDIGLGEELPAADDPAHARSIAMIARLRKFLDHVEKYAADRGVMRVLEKLVGALPDPESKENHLIELDDLIKAYGRSVREDRAILKDARRATGEPVVDGKGDDLAAQLAARVVRPFEPPVPRTQERVAGVRRRNRGGLATGRSLEGPRRRRERAGIAGVPAEGWRASHCGRRNDPDGAQASPLTS